MPTILHVYLDFGQFGGIERQILRLAQAIPNSVVACGERGVLYRALGETAVPVYGLNPRFRRQALRPWDLPLYQQLYRIIDRVQPSLVHVHAGHLENLFFKALGLPVIYTFHGYGALYQGTGLIKRWNRFCYQQTEAAWDAVLYVSDAERRDMRSNCGSVVYNGMNLAPWQHAAPGGFRHALGIPDNAQVISFINRLDSNKDPLAFLAMAEQLAAPHRHFVIAGDGPLLAAVQAQAQTLHQVHVLGHIGNVPGLLKETDLAVFTSRREGFGLGVLEAMACGTVPLALARGGVAEVIGPHPECLAEDPQALVRQAHILLHLPAQQRASLLNKLQLQAARFQEEPWLRQMEGIYERVGFHHHARLSGRRIYQEGRRQRDAANLPALGIVDC